MAGYTPGEQPTDRSLVKLNTNENPYPASPRVARAVVSSALDELRLYPSPVGEPLRSKAAQVYGVAPEQVLVGNGSDELLALCLRACVCEGDAVAYTTPTYSLYRTLVTIVGGRRVEIPCVDATMLPGALRETSARVKLVCSPNSPFGWQIPLAAIAELATARDCVVVADEAYVDFGGDSALELLDEHPNLLVTRSFSKSFSLAGLRLGLAFASGELIAELAKVKDSYNVSRLAIAAGVAALEDYAYMQANVSRVAATRDRVVARLREEGRCVLDSRANFFWLDCGTDGGESTYRRLRRAGILVRYFDDPALRHGVRISVGTDDEMERFLEALLGG
jgi:histidinol-phosphate aminotransferase